MRIRIPSAPPVLLALFLFLPHSIPAASQAAGPIPIPPSDQILRALQKGHPRLLLSHSALAQLKQRINSSPQLKSWQEALRREAAKILKQAPSQYEIPDGKRLLATSRRVMNRVYVLGLLYRLDKDPRYLDRAWQELKAAAEFKDWNPSHFLDTAEMTHAFAIGYDWLYDAWSESQRRTLREAIIEKGLKLGVLSHEGKARYGWWHRAHHNWNQVCNGGIGMGALALADEEPELAAQFLHAALQSIQLAMVQYGPDGAWAEGPGYWNYATSYNVVFLAALQTSLGTDFGLSRIEGFGQAGMFPLYITGPLGRTFNYADGSDGTIRSPSLFWLAQQFNHPAYATYENQVASPQPLDLVWRPAKIDAAALSQLPLDKYFRNAEVVTFRSAWDDKDALFVGFKAGDNQANHSNLDLGTFVLDALGKRWAVDLGADNYNLPGYFGNQRWTYYRMRAESHNTLVLNPGAEPDQDPRAAGKIVKFKANPDRALAVADLSAAYARHASRVHRGIMRQRNGILVQDEIEAPQSADVWWFLHTPAQIKISPDGKTAELRQGEVSLEARLLSPSQARFTQMDAAPLATSPNPDRQRKNTLIRKLAIHLEQAKDLRLIVRLEPQPGSLTATNQEMKDWPALKDW